MNLDAAVIYIVRLAILKFILLYITLVHLRIEVDRARQWNGLINLFKEPRDYKAFRDCWPHAEAFLELKGS